MGWEQGICKHYSASLYGVQEQILYSDSLRVLNSLWGIGLRCQEAVWMPVGTQITRLEGTAKSSHKDTVKTPLVEQLPFHSCTLKTLHLKPVCLGLFFSWRSLVVFCSAFPSVVGTNTRRAVASLCMGQTMCDNHSSCTPFGGIYLFSSNNYY